MAHVHAYGDAAPAARPIIHLGATSCYVTDNADLILIRSALEIVRDKTAAAIDALGQFAEQSQGAALPGLHPLPAGAARDGRQAGRALVPRADPRPARDRAPARRAEVPGRQGDDRHAGQLPRALRRRRRQGRGARPHGGRGVRLRRDLSRHRPDLLAARSTPRSSAPWRASPRAPTGSAPTCGCWPTSASSRSRSRPSRSAPRRWPTSATRCGPSACARWPGSSWPCRRPPARPRRPSGWSAPSTTAPSAG